MTLTRKEIEGVDEVFARVQSENRTNLFEFEVYQILDCIGLDTPRYSFIQDPTQINENLLQDFNHSVIIKIVSSTISHKQKYGGVKKVDYLDPLFVQFAINQMRQEVLSHFDKDNPPAIEGFLLVEFIPHTQALGYEVLIGSTEDQAFGPVLTLSKGGNDAEFFAKYFDPANFFLPPLDKKEAKRMVNTLNIRHKFKEFGHLEYLDLFTKTILAMSKLAYHYSGVRSDDPGFIITSLDVNPFVITNDGRFVAIDGYAEFVETSERSIPLPDINPSNLEGFFNPTGIAVIGVSADMDRYSLGRDVAHLLHDMDREDLYMINPKGGEITFDNKPYPLYKNLQEVTHPIDLIVYAAPARFIESFMSELSPLAPKGIILIPGIPSDLEYDEFIKRLDKVKPPQTRVIGPNCMGVFRAPEDNRKGVNTLFMEQERLEIGYSQFSNTLLLTQSGAFSVTALDRFHHSKIFKSIVSFGNQFDVRVTDLIEYYSQRETIDVIALYLEGLHPGEGRQFFELGLKSTKPIIIYKSGKTDAGAKAAASHTAAMSGSYDVFKAACRQAGFILVENIEEHYDIVQTFSLLHQKIPKSNRVAGVVNAGFESTVGADELKNLTQATMSAETIDKLNKINRFGLVDTRSPFLDISPMADDRMYADFVEAVLQDENVDCVFVAIVPHPISLKTTPQTCRDQDGLASLLVDLSVRYSKPMVVSVNAGQYYQEFVGILESNGLPVFTDIRSAIKSLDTFVSYYTKA
jgi:3-hydroxypropionyl-CoA synthetase (ADP-forming)